MDIPSNSDEWTNGQFHNETRSDASREPSIDSPVHSIVWSGKLTVILNILYTIGTRNIWVIFLLGL